MTRDELDAAWALCKLRGLGEEPCQECGEPYMPYYTTSGDSLVWNGQLGSREEQRSGKRIVWVCKTCYQAYYDEYSMPNIEAVVGDDKVSITLFREIPIWQAT